MTNSPIRGYVPADKSERHFKRLFVVVIQQVAEVFFADGGSTAEASARLRLQTGFRHRRGIGLEFFFVDLYQIASQSDHAIRRAGDFRLA